LWQAPLLTKLGFGARLPKEGSPPECTALFFFAASSRSCLCILTSFSPDLLTAIILRHRRRAFGQRLWLLDCPWSPRLPQVGPFIALLLFVPAGRPPVTSRAPQLGLGYNGAQSVGNHSFKRPSLLQTPFLWFPPHKWAIRLFQSFFILFLLCSASSSSDKPPCEDFFLNPHTAGVFLIPVTTIPLHTRNTSFTRSGL